MTQIILLYSVLLVLSSFIIVGFYSISRGRWELKPDGTKFWTGKILKGYHRWLQTHTVKMVPYGNEEWLKIFFQLKSFLGDKQIILIDQNFAVVKVMDEVTTRMFFAFAISKGIKINIVRMKEADRVMVAAYREIQEYKLPEWVRDPLGMCINCMASVFGTLLWIFWVALAKHINGLHETEVVTIFLQIGWGFKIVLWGLFCITLAHLNEYILNIVKK